MFDDDLNSQFSFEFTSKLKFKMAATQSDGSVSQENIEFNTFNDQNDQNSPLQVKFQNISVNKQIEFAKLKIQQLQLKLQVQKLAVSLNSIPDLFQLSTFPVQFIQFDNRVNNYRKKVAFKN